MASLAALLPAVQRQPAFAEAARAILAAQPSTDPIRLSLADPAKPAAMAFALNRAFPGA